jgi:phage shock protein C
VSGKKTPSKEEHDEIKKPDETPFEKNVRDFAQEIEHLGKKTGRHIEQGMKQFGEEVSTLGKQAGKTEKNVETWYDRTFGIFGPLLASLLGFIIFLLIIKAMEFSGGNVVVFHDMSAFLSAHLSLFFALILFFAYASYGTRKYHFQLRWISPILSAIGFILVVWIVIEIFKILKFLDIPFFETVGLSIEYFLIPLFILILIIGYLVFVLTLLTKHRQVTGKITNSSSNDTATSTQTPEPLESHQYKPLYRSGKYRILGGVCGGVAEYFSLDPLFVRLLFVIGVILTVGFFILVYFLCWIMIPRNPNQKWH